MFLPNELCICRTYGRNGYEVNITYVVIDSDSLIPLFIVKWKQYYGRDYVSGRYNGFNILKIAEWQTALHTSNRSREVGSTNTRHKHHGYYDPAETTAIIVPFIASYVGWTNDSESG